METIIPNSTPFLTLLDSFLKFLESKRYTPNVLNNYRRTLTHIDGYKNISQVEVALSVVRLSSSDPVLFDV